MNTCASVCIKLLKVVHSVYGEQKSCRSRLSPSGGTKTLSKNVTLYSGGIFIEDR